MPPYFEKETCEWQMPTVKSDEPYFRCHVNEREHPMKCHNLGYRIIGHDLQSWKSDWIPEKPSSPKQAP